MQRSGVQSGSEYVSVNLNRKIFLARGASPPDTLDMLGPLALA